MIWLYIQLAGEVGLAPQAVGGAGASKLDWVDWVDWVAMACSHSRKVVGHRQLRTECLRLVVIDAEEAKEGRGDMWTQETEAEAGIVFFGLPCLKSVVPHGIKFKFISINIYI